MEYEINESTIAIISIDKNKSKILDMDGEKIINKKAFKIMDQSCKYYGSTYDGRVKSGKEMLNGAYKIPVIVQESNKIIFFPTKSFIDPDCCWINFNLIKNFKKVSNMITEVTFTNGTTAEFSISKLGIENQIMRSIRIESIMNKRNEFSKSNYKV